MKNKILPLILLFVISNGTAQNVGIGTANPTDKLHVAGNVKADTVKPSAIKFTPNAANGKVLTSDAGGNASWQEIVASGTGSGSAGVGYGSWGDCTMSGVSQYNPVADSAGAADDNYGGSVSLSGNFAIIGANSDDIGANADQGSVSIFEQSGGKWTLKQKITDAGGQAEDFFGSSVYISGNYAVIGAPGDDEGISNQGSVSVYQYNGANWVFMQKLTDATGAIDDKFGSSVCISGNYIIAGSPDDDNGATLDQGSISIFQLNGGSWVFMQKLTDATGAANDRFGFSVTISGNYAAGGAPEDDAIKGSVTTFQYNGSTWVLMQKITDPGGSAFDQFGCSISISGNLILIGAFGDDTNKGSASVFQYNGSNWVLMQTLTDPAGSSNDFFGVGVSLSGSYALIGSSNDDISGSLDKGSAHIYLRLGSGWQRIQSINDPGGVAFEFFGSATAIDAQTQRFLIGANGYSSASGKAVFGKVN